MKHKIMAVILAASAAFSGISMQIFALPDQTPVSLPVGIDISKGSITVTGTQITYYKDSGGVPVVVTDSTFPAAGYKITGIQPATSILSINGTNTPLTLAPTTGLAYQVTGNLKADKSLTLIGSIKILGDLTANAAVSSTGALEATGSVTAQLPPALSGTVKADGGLTVNTGDFATTAQLTIGGTLKTLAGRMELNGVTRTGAISSAGDLTLGAQTSATSIYAAGNLTLRAQTSATSISSGGNLTLGAQTSATSISSGGNLTLGAQTNATSLSANGSLTASVPIVVTGNVQADNGNITFGSSAQITGSLNALQGSIQADAELRAGGVQAANGTVYVKGNAIVNNDMVAKGELRIDGTASAKSIYSTGSGVVLGGNTTASTAIRGSSVTVNNRAWVKTPAITPSVAGASNRNPVDLQTPFAAGTSVTIKNNNVNDMPAVIGESLARSTGLRLWLPAGANTVTVQSGSKSYSGSVQVSGTGAPVSLTIKAPPSDPPAGGGGSGNVGGTDSFDEEDYWDAVVRKMKSAKSGDTVRTSIPSETNNIPTWVLEELSGRNIILRVSQGSSYIDLNGKKLPSIPSNQVYYKFDALKSWYTKGQKPEKPPVSSSEAPVIPSVPLPKPPAASTAPPAASTPPVSSASSASSSSSSSEESSLPEEPSSSEEEELDEVIAAEEEEQVPPPAPPKEKRSIVPLVVAGAVIALVAAAAVVGYILYKRKAEGYLDGDDTQRP